jgi:hypothetical protein
MQFEWTKYKRVFAFGCSFTSYTYPTWANIIMYQTPAAELYNFGASGMGNLAIASRIAEANTRFKFNEHDLILVMYTTMFREDRWIETHWRSHGCVFNQPFYDKNFVKNYVDPTGCLIRDLAMIELSTNYVKNLPCDSLLLRYSGIDDECDFLRENNAEIVDNILSVYNELWNSFPPSLGETLFPHGWVTRSTMIYGGKAYDDSHPITSDYYQYLKLLGLNLSVDTEDYAIECDKKIAKFSADNDWATYFPELFEVYTKSGRSLI